MIHLMPHWNFKGLEGEEIRVSAYTNCEEAELILNGQDITMITCYCEDAQGRMVSDAAAFVHFHSNNLGTVVGTGSDVSDHIPVTVTSRRMRAGAIGVAVKVGTQSGVLKVYAKAEGLEAAVLSMKI